MKLEDNEEKIVVLVYIVKVKEELEEEEVDLFDVFMNLIVILEVSWKYVLFYRYYEVVCCFEYVYFIIIVLF